MRIFSITVALLVSAALYLLIFERDRLMSFSQLKPTPDDLKNEILITFIIIVSEYSEYSVINLKE